MAGLPVAQPFGCLVAGYNVRDELPECWLIEADTTNATLSAPISLIPDETGIYWAGQPRWISRLLLGIDQDGVASALKNAFQVADDKILAALDAIKSYTEVPMVHPAMPLQDAIDLGRFLVQMTATSVRFSPGEQTVGGPVEIAAITRHEGFRWIDRKLYFDARLNGETMR